MLKYMEDCVFRKGTDMSKISITMPADEYIQLCC